jgi:predicted DNA-binding protein
MASGRLSVRIPESLQENLESVVEVTGKTEAEVVREALEDYCLKHARLPTAYEVARDAGAIGCVKQGPADRSTNPKYLEGLGRDGDKGRENQ